MSVEKVAADLRRVLHAFDLAPLAQALQLIDEAERVVAAATHGSLRPEAGQAIALLGHAKQQLGQVYQQVEQARQLIQQYLTNIAGGQASTPSSPVPSSPVPNRAGSRQTTTTPSKLTREQADAIRVTLPPQVPTPNPTGKKTHGKWLGGRGSEAIVSGYDEDAAEVWRLLQGAG